MHAVIQELSKGMADYKSQAQASAPRVWFGPTQQQPQQHEQQQRPPFGSQPVLMWDQSMTPGNGRQSVSWGDPQTAGGQPGEGAMTAQLLQKLQKTQEKLETRDASARKYKVHANKHLLSLAQRGLAAAIASACCIEDLAFVSERTACVDLT